jgi:hypothetical protein
MCACRRCKRESRPSRPGVRDAPVGKRSSVSLRGPHQPQDWWRPFVFVRELRVARRRACSRRLRRAIRCAMRGARPQAPPWAGCRSAPWGYRPRSGPAWRAGPRSSWRSWPAGEASTLAGARNTRDEPGTVDAHLAGRQVSLRTRRHSKLAPLRRPMWCDSWAMTSSYSLWGIGTRCVRALLLSRTGAQREGRRR